jgi:hypothetical protein
MTPGGEARETLFNAMYSVRKSSKGGRGIIVRFTFGK